MSECVVEPVPSIEPCPTTTDGVSVGDKLRCKDSSFSALALRIGEWHTVTYVAPHSTRVCVTGSTVHWELSRFDKIIRNTPAPAPVEEPSPYADWKTGDSVRCLDDLCSKGLLHSQHVYEIEQILHPNKLLCLVGVAENWGFSRFERVAPIVDVHSEPDKPVVRVGSRVRCDDASGTGVILGEGNVYTVSAVQLHGSDTFLRLNECSGMGWDISRFTLLLDEVAPVVPAAQTDQSDVDLITAHEARRLADEHFMVNGRELQLAIKAAIDTAVANGEFSAHVLVPDVLFVAVKRWLAKSGHDLSVDPGFRSRIISWE